MLSLSNSAALRREKSQVRILLGTPIISIGYVVFICSSFSFAHHLLTTNSFLKYELVSEV